MSAFRASEALLAVALLGCAACSSSSDDAKSTDAGCATGDYPQDGAFDPLYACSAPVV